MMSIHRENCNKVLSSIAIYSLFSIISVVNAQNTPAIAHITDMHIDPDYIVGSNPNIDGRNCQVPFVNKTDGEHGAGQFGDPKCDSPPALVKSASGELARRYNYDAIYWTGDDVAHILDNETTEAKALQGITLCAESLAKAFSQQKVDMFASLGNHDAYPTDSFVGGMALYEKIAKVFADNGFLNRGTAEWDSFLKGGYYSRLMTSQPELKVISLNTILWYAENKAVDPDKENDPAGQFAWFEDELADAREQGLTVHILGHVPPGFDENIDVEGGSAHMHKAYNDRFVQLLIDYSDEIQAGFYGHEHTDAFRAFVKPTGASDDESPKWEHFHTGFIAPAVTPWANSWHRGDTSNNPGIRVYHLTPRFSTAQSIDYQQFYTDLLADNANGMIEWDELTTATDAYPDHHSAYYGIDWLRLAVDMASSGVSSKMFKTFDRLNFVDFDNHRPPCDELCFKTTVCSALAATTEVFAACAKDPASFAKGVDTSKMSQSPTPIPSAMNSPSPDDKKKGIPLPIAIGAGSGIAVVGLALGVLIGRRSAARKHGDDFSRLP